MESTEKKIQHHKKLSRNTYHISDNLFSKIWLFIFSFTICSVFEPLFSFFPVSWILVCLFVATLVTFMMTLQASFQNYNIEAYTRKSFFSFLGLFNLAQKKVDLRDRDIIPRNKEVNFLSRLVEEVIFPQGSIKQAVCLTGKSGCGKSTILAFFQNKYQSEESVTIYNFSGNYNNLKATLEQEFETSNIDDYITSELKNGKKFIFIFDQFERYFFVSSAYQKNIRYFIASLCQKNTAIIISLREEYLAEFLREFDLNDLKSNQKMNTEVKHFGLLRALAGYIKDHENYLVIQGSRRKITFSKWKKEHIKDPINVHILDPMENGIAEFTDTDITLFYCENQNNIKTIFGGSESSSDVMSGKCIDCFGEELGKILYEKNKNKPLIEQQIIFHMIEFDIKCRGNRDFLPLYCDMSDEEIMKKYFDIQLSSTNEYYHAIRIMYLLSTARLHQISLSTDNIENGLIAKQFSKSGSKQIRQALNELEQIQLIRRSNQNSENEYEIAHDYIANAFISYCQSNMNRNVRTALDIYIHNFIDSLHEVVSEDGVNNYKTKYFNKDFLNKKTNHSNYYFKIIAIVFSVLIITSDIIYRYVFNPWQIWDNPLQDSFPVFISIDLLVCVLYFYQMFDKVFQYRISDNNMHLKVIYFILGLLALLSILFYPHFIMIEGSDLAIIGTTSLTLLDKDYRESSRKELQSYGLKCMLLGFTFMLVHLMFCIFNHVFTTDIIMLEIIAMALLSGFAHLSHLTKEYLFGRRIDVSIKNK